MRMPSRSYAAALGAVALSGLVCAAVLTLPVVSPVGDAFAQSDQQKPAKQKAKAPKAAKAKPTKPTKEAPPPITDDTDDPAVWGKTFPLHYELYSKTVDMERTKYGGSEAEPRTPTQADPRTVVAKSKVEEDIGLKTMWQGYAFAADFREDRGHAYANIDQRNTGRQAAVKQPGSCMNCHASSYVAMKKTGDGDITKGFEKMNAMPFADAAKLVSHPVSCIDCHDSQTMALRITRPALIEGLRALKASQGIQNYDVNKQASNQEMRAYVCAQCHVEYYFKGADRRLVFPWSKGLKVENMQAFYDEIGYRDWTHKDTGAPALKAQHPEFEMWSQGIHARAGVTCSDCHMPVVKHSGQTVSDHWVRSPLLNVDNACMGCHQKGNAKLTAKELKDRVETIQDRHMKLRNDAMTALMGLIGDLKAAKAGGKADAELKTAQYLQRRAQFYLDFVEAENSTGFHAPQEAARILGESLDMSRQGQIALRDASFKPTVAVIDIPPPPALPPLVSPAAQ